jgi:putative ABC transport system permease protein
MLIWCQFPEFIDIKGLEFEKEDFINQKPGANVIVLGSEIASSLFEAVEPIGKNVGCTASLPYWSVEETRCAAVWQSDDTSFIPVNF